MTNLGTSAGAEFSVPAKRCFRLSVLHERARVAALTRSRAPDDLDLVNARRQLKAERLAAFIVKTVASAPELTSEQRSTLALLLNPGPQPRTIPAAGHTGQVRSV